jgi:hypothetical protein
VIKTRTTPLHQRPTSLPPQQLRSWPLTRAKLRASQLQTSRLTPHSVIYVCGLDGPRRPRRRYPSSPSPPSTHLLLPHPPSSCSPSSAPSGPSLHHGGRCELVYFQHLEPRVTADLPWPVSCRQWQLGLPRVRMNKTVDQGPNHPCPGSETHGLTDRITIGLCNSFASSCRRCLESTLVDGCHSYRALALGNIYISPRASHSRSAPLQRCSASLVAIRAS